MADDKLTHTIAKLRAQYAEQLPATVAQMGDLWRRLAAGEVPLTRFPELVRAAHSITGSGTTFGLPAVTQAARDLESFLEPFAESGRLPSGAEQDTVLALLAALGQSAART